MNLLPDTEKKLLKKGLNQRFLLVLCYTTMAAFMVGLVALLPGFLLARAKFFEVTSKAGLAVVNGNDTKTKTLLSLPAEINEKLQIFQTNTPNPEIIQHISLIVSSAKSGITVRSFSFVKTMNQQGNQERIITIAGVALERKNLIDFADTLKRSELFASVDVPVSNLTKNRDLPFSVKLIIKD